MARCRSGMRFSVNTKQTRIQRNFPVNSTSLPLPQILVEIPMEEELLEMAAQWRTTAQEMIAKSEAGSRSEMVNQMLMACAQMLEWKIKRHANEHAG